MMSDTPQPDGVMAEVVPIETDRPCARCGYNLRGLKPDGHCPECGSSIEQSLQGNFLRFADPVWLDKLRFGTTLMIWNIIIMVIALVGVSVLTGVLGLPPILVVILSLIASGIGVAAAILVTSPEPTVIPSADPVTLRKVVRSAAVLSFLGDVVKLTSAFAGLGIAFEIVGGVLSLAGVVYGFGLLAYFRRLALRVPDEGLAKSTRALMWGMVICTVMAIVLIVIAAALSAGAGGGMMAVSCVAAVAVLVLFIWYIVIVVKCNRRFAEAARFARSNETAGFRGIGLSPQERPF